jgi:hypothetical protein
MQNRFESNFTLKLYKKKLEEIRMFKRSIAKFNKIFKMKNDEFDNLSDKRFKDIVDAYKRNHPIEKKPINNNYTIKNEKIHSLKKSRSYLGLDNLNTDVNRNNLYKRIYKDEIDDNEKNTNQHYKNKINFQDDDIHQEKKGYIKYSGQENFKKNEIKNKSSIHLIDFNSQPSKFSKKE